MSYVESRNADSLRASQACIPCRKQKRKCDKNLPTCGLCRRVGRTCQFSLSPAHTTPESFRALGEKVAERQDRLDARTGSPILAPLQSENPSNAPTSFEWPLASPAPPLNWRSPPTFPSILYLDSKFFDKKGHDAAPPIIIPEEAFQALSGAISVEAVYELYFTTVHKWMPFVSRKTLHSTIFKQALSPAADLVVLLLGMQLATLPLLTNAEPRKQPLYLLVKRSLLIVESHNLMSLRLLQAKILLAVYELGQAIFPEAYLSIGECSRLGYAYGIHRRVLASHALPRPRTWTEMEERRRVWWTIFILDRHVNLGNNGAPLAVEEPPATAQLPVDDEMWDHGEISSNTAVFISSPPSVVVSPFARVCQASHLLGRVLRHHNDDTLDAPFRLTEAAQLERTLGAFMDVLLSDKSNDVLSLSSSIAICYSALLTLYDPYLCTESTPYLNTPGGTNFQAQAIRGVQTHSKSVVLFTRNIIEIIHSSYSLEATSPLICHALYHAAATFAWLYKETDDEGLRQNWDDMRTSLKMLRERWKIAGEYVNLLETMEPDLRY